MNQLFGLQHRRRTDPMIQELIVGKNIKIFQDTIMEL